MIFTAIRPDFGFPNGREVSLLSVAPEVDDQPVPDALEGA